MLYFSVCVSGNGNWPEANGDYLQDDSLPATRCADGFVYYKKVDGASVVYLFNSYRGRDSFWMSNSVLCQFDGNYMGGIGGTGTPDTVRAEDWMMYRIDRSGYDSAPAITVTMGACGECSSLQ